MQLERRKIVIRSSTLSPQLYLWDMLCHSPSPPQSCIWWFPTKIISLLFYITVPYNLAVTKFLFHFLRLWSFFLTTKLFICKKKVCAHLILTYYTSHMRSHQISPPCSCSFPSGFNCYYTIDHILKKILHQVRKIILFDLQ